VQLKAAANSLNALKSAAGLADTRLPDSMIPARKGALTGVWRVIASATDCAPADWPCQQISSESLNIAVRQAISAVP
jgi:hypothetical protein